eukprot:scaffold81130_cov60-Phaeocystis_antarctica.AAC.5
MPVGLKAGRVEGAFLILRALRRAGCTAPPEAPRRQRLRSGGGAGAPPRALREAVRGDGGAVDTKGGRHLKPAGTPRGS